METFQTHPVSLGHLLSSIHERKLALPDFQRDFVWDAGATEELIESIARSFPAGSLLVMPYRAKEFEPRAVTGAPDLDGVAPNELVLDGQQRLTSLYQAFHGRGDHRYFVDLNVLIAGDDIQEAVFYRHRNRCGRYASVDQQAKELIFPLGVLFGSKGGFHAWLYEVVDRRPEEGDDLVGLREQLLMAYNDYVKRVEEYRFPVVSLGQETELEAVCSIFETLNRTGIRLSVFELLAARYFAQGLDLRRKWQDTKASAKLVEDFAVDEYHVLQSIALRVRRSVKRGDVLRLTKEDIEEHWDPVTRGYGSALAMLRDDCGVKAAKWLPYAYLLVPMAALWQALIEDLSGPAAGGNRMRLKQWFWCSGFSQSYDRAANTQAAKDYVELERWLTGGALPEVVAEFEFEKSRLREITPRQQSIYKALISLVLSNGAVDFHHASPLTPESMAAKGVDDHHIFPQAYLNPPNEDRRQPQELVDCILNRTLIDADTNKSIGKQPPSNYLAKVRDELAEAPAGAFDHLLDSHLLPSGEKSPLLVDRFAEFLSWREDRLYEEVSRLTRKPIPSETPDDFALT